MQKNGVAGPTVMAEGQTGEGSTSPQQPYPPSWVDRLISVVRRSPGPAWVYYVGAWLVLFCLETAIKWRDGAYPVGTFFLFHAVYTGLGIYALALMHYLDNAGRTALAAARPSLTVDDSQFADLMYRTTVLPARPTVLASMAGLVVAVLLAVLTANTWAQLKIITSPSSGVVDVLLFLFQWWVLGALIYHTVRQLRIISQIYTRHTQIDLFRMGPLYALSGLTARTALGLVALNYAWFATASGTVAQPTSLAITLFLALMAIVAFTSPLFGVHRLLEREKRRMLGEIAQLLQRTIAEFHRRLDSGELTDMDQMDHALAGLANEQRMVAGIPTWPWQPETVRLLATAILLPVVLWFIQRVLQRAIGL